MYYITVVNPVGLAIQQRVGGVGVRSALNTFIT